ncbi:cytochrome P460 family protein [Ovoidimarina sediminis]|uniref:cytochrome P460 family protein n=1 Tax=Ovoidimarina sediminis TaxID=3079856 RepID=UPI002914DE42|nr:cytochrome P460 family protein [Rhodophyticola sp. MJ-SS7]MDU8942791.1 cytochrome P460 family protein [Rhodophyticola sp. MJ-SS7]
MRIAAPLAATAVAAFFLTAPAARAVDCPVAEGTDRFPLNDEEVLALYDCIKDWMAESYASEGDEIGATYRSWTVTATRPAVAGAHSERFLQTFANDIAAEQYLKFETEGVTMPVGSVLAKESFGINAKTNMLRRGPLFIMTKVAAGEAPDTMGWVYSALQPNGKPMTFKQSFCHDCHAGWEDQDALAYPLEEVRVTPGN